MQYQNRMAYKGILSKWNFLFEILREINESSSGLKFCVFIESYMCIAATYENKRLQELYLMRYSGQDAFNYLFRTARRNVLEYITPKRFGSCSNLARQHEPILGGRPCCSTVVFSRRFRLRRCLCVPGTTTVSLSRSPSLS